MSCAFIFPGQGSQKVGMFSAFTNGFNAGMKVIEEVEDAISFKISRLIEEGPIEELTKTEYAQPAIFAVTMACIAVLEKEYGFNIQKNLQYLAGHSLGEYSALCASGAIPLYEAAKLVKDRGRLMADACPNGSSEFSMASILGIGVAAVEEIVAPFQCGKNICVIANDNSATQVVISGHAIAVKEVSEKAKEAGAGRVIELNTSGPFHSPLMVKAAIGFDKALSACLNVSDLKVPVLMNLTAEPLANKDDLHSMLVRHLTERVRWRETIQYLMDKKIDRIIEIGPCKKLSSMISRDYPYADVCTIETVAQMEEFVKLS